MIDKRGVMSPFFFKHSYPLALVWALLSLSWGCEEPTEGEVEDVEAGSEAGAAAGAVGGEGGGS